MNTQKYVLLMQIYYSNIKINETIIATIYFSLDDSTHKVVKLLPGKHVDGNNNFSWSIN